MKSDPNASGSLSSGFRRRRILILKSLLEKANLRRVNCVDLGGTASFWKANISYIGTEFYREITIVNLKAPKKSEKIHYVFFKTILGEATSLNQIKDKQFDFCFSNSVTEHVGNLKDQKSMADEVKRISKHRFVQKPNLYFPIGQLFIYLFFNFTLDL